jgi:hypothetical protein
VDECKTLLGGTGKTKLVPVGGTVSMRGRSAGGAGGGAGGGANKGTINAGITDEIQAQLEHILTGMVCHHEVNP